MSKILIDMHIISKNVSDLPLHVFFSHRVFLLIVYLYWDSNPGQRQQETAATITLLKIVELPTNFRISRRVL